MSGRKAVMVDTETWNRLEKYRHNAYIRAIGDAVGDLLAVNGSDRYYVGLKHTRSNKLVVCSFGRTDEEAVRSLLSKYDRLTMGDVRTEDDIAAGEECFFTMECTKRLYDLKEFLDGVKISLNISFVDDFVFADSLSDLITVEIKEDLFGEEGEITGELEYKGKHLADLEDSYFALADNTWVYCVGTEIQDIVDEVRKAFEDLINRYTRVGFGAHQCLTGGDEFEDVDTADEMVLSEELEKLEYFFNTCVLLRCSAKLYCEAAAAGHGPHGFSRLQDTAHICTGGELRVSDYLLISPDEEKEGLYGGLAMKNGETWLISCGKTYNEALYNAGKVNLPDGFEKKPVAAKCTKELYLAFVQSELFVTGEGMPVPCEILEGKIDEKNNKKYDLSCTVKAESGENPGGS